MNLRKENQLQFWKLIEGKLGSCDEERLGLKAEQGAFLFFLFSFPFGFFTSFLSQKSRTSDFVLLFHLSVIKWYLADKYTTNENTKNITFTKKIPI